MLQFGANLIKFDQQIKYLARGAIRAGNYSLNFRLGPGNTHSLFMPAVYALMVKKCIYACCECTDG